MGDDGCQARFPTNSFLVARRGVAIDGRERTQPWQPVPCFNTLSIVYCSSPLLSRFQIQRPERGGRGAGVPV